jgi:hypothetical protein
MPLKMFSLGKILMARGAFPDSCNQASHGMITAMLLKQIWKIPSELLLEKS